MTQQCPEHQKTRPFPAQKIRGQCSEYKMTRQCIETKMTRQCQEH